MNDRVNYYRNLLVEKQLNELATALKMKFGTKGNLTPTILQDPKELFKSTYEKMDSIMQSGSKVDIDHEFQNDIAYQIWLNYIKAMFGDFHMSAAQCCLTLLR